MLLYTEFMNRSLMKPHGVHSPCVIYTSVIYYVVVSNAYVSKPTLITTVTFGGNLAGILNGILPRYMLQIIFVSIKLSPCNMGILKVTTWYNSYYFCFIDRNVYPLEHNLYYFLSQGSKKPLITLK